MSSSLPTASLRGAEVSSSTKCVSCRMRFASGNPLSLDTPDYLLAQTVVLDGTRRARRELENTLAIGRALLQTNALRDHRLEDLLAEHATDLAGDVARQHGSPIVKRNHDTQKLQLG